jgi:hypothetical protein
MLVDVVHLAPDDFTMGLGRERSIGLEPTVPAPKTEFSPYSLLHVGGETEIAISLNPSVTTIFSHRINTLTLQLFPRLI